MSKYNIQGEAEIKYGEWRSAYYCKECHKEVSFLTEPVCRNCGFNMSVYAEDSPKEEKIRPVYMKVMKEGLIFKTPKWQIIHWESTSGNRIYGLV